MIYRYSYQAVALVEFKEAIDWYNYRSIMAARNFVEEVTNTIGVICKDPLRFRNVYSVFREVALKKYPYTIVYFVDEKKKKVIITSVFHNKRNSAKKYRK
jgi:plasmid stabilization system protein ParE